MTRYRRGFAISLVAVLGAVLAVPAVIRAAATRSGVAPVAPAAAPRPVTLPFTGELTQGGWIRGTLPAGMRSLSLDGTPIKVAPDGGWFAAFDRDAGPQALLRTVLANGSIGEQRLAVSPRAWNIENVNIARSPGGPSEAFMALRRPELARINAARTLVTDAQGWRQRFVWPAKGRISGRFGSQRVYRGEPGAYHSGLDISSGTSGTPFVAPADGVVILAAEKPFTLEGNLLMLDHGMGLNSAFLHCSQILVKEGDHVKQGQVIARIGMTGRATGPHLHWSIKWNDARLDPLLFLGPMN
ncbi:M23 family metallopeptidase [Novosphingobium sp. P6W]|uniref:M23 family metallopeptidase n=1 Tax=Novosphingobium sp. P6W TaxID=1609758 RepID=UPI0009E35250|nr:M23 family metallopeptidase [Novosphingobium sp. P6W]AXB75134.1 M23 family peptidase [Novosphingobium sp. P6W]